MFDDVTRRDLITLCEAESILPTIDAGGLGQVAHLLLARELAGRVIALPATNTGHFALLDAYAFGAFDVATQLAGVLAGGRANPGLPHDGARRARMYFSYSTGTADPSIGERVTVPPQPSWFEPQISADGALVALAGAVFLEGPLAARRSYWQHLFDVRAFTAARPEVRLTMIGGAGIAPGIRVPLWQAWPDVPLPDGYTIVGGDQVSVPATAEYAARAWGTVRVASTANPATATIALVGDGVDAVTATVERDSADPDEPVAFELFTTGIPITTSIAIEPIAGPPVIVEGELQIRRLL